jgi:FkbM family methyltransferase
MTISHAYKNISRFRKRYGIITGIRAIIHYFFVAIRKSKLDSKNFVIEVNDTQLEVIPGDLGTSLELLLFKTHEPISTQIVKETLEKGMTCLDIGANIGYYVTLESKVIGDQGKILAIEPSPLNFEFLKRNMELQSTKNIEVFNFAAGDKIGQINFVMDENESNSGRVISDDKVTKWSGPVTKLPVKTIDSFLDEIKIDKIDFLRMDVEGYEYHIFQGMKNTIKKSKPIIAIEVHKSIMGVETTKKWLNELKNEGYELKSYIPRELDAPFIGTLNDVKHYSIYELIKKLENNELPSFFMLTLQNKNDS